MPEHSAPPAPTRVKREHFQILTAFGRNPIAQKASAEYRERLWAMCCETGHLPYVPHAEVVEAWKKYVTGTSRESNLAIDGNIDPNYVTMGVTYKGHCTAAHTVRTPTLLQAILTIYARTFGSEEDFAANLKARCADAWQARGK